MSAQDLHALPQPPKNTDLFEDLHMEIKLRNPEKIGIYSFMVGPSDDPGISSDHVIASGVRAPAQGFRL